MRVERVVGEVRDPVGEADAERLRRRRRRLDLPRVRADPVAHLPGQVRVLEHLEDPNALRGVVPAVRREVRRQGLLAGVAERRVADVVAERDRLGQRLVEAERRGQRARDLGDLHRVGQARDEVVALGVEEDLRLVLQPAERLGVDDPVAVALERGAELVGLLRAARGPRLAADRVAGGLRRSSSASRASRSRRRSAPRRADLLHAPMMPCELHPLWAMNGAAFSS